MATKNEKEDEQPLAAPPVKRMTTREREDQLREEERKRQQAGERSGEVGRPKAPEREDDTEQRGQLLIDRPSDYIERTLPEDRLPAEISRGQTTRDNVNPNIPSADRGQQGPIVDPSTLGMEQGGIAPPEPQEAPPVLQGTQGAAPTPQQTPPLDTPHGTGSAASINEPVGSTIGSENPGGPGGPPAPEGGGEAETPVITALEPDECTIGEETFDLFVIGTGFNEESVIVFAGQDEPTDLEDDGSLSTGINMDVWNGPDTVKVSVKNGDKTSNEMDFTFHAEAAQRKAPPKQQKRKGKGVKAKKKR
jgi:hypothetical protein